MLIVCFSLLICCFCNIKYDIWAALNTLRVASPCEDRSVCCLYVLRTPCLTGWLWYVSTLGVTNHSESLSWSLQNICRCFKTPLKRSNIYWIKIVMPKLSSGFEKTWRKVTSGNTACLGIACYDLLWWILQKCVNIFPVHINVRVLKHRSLWSSTTSPAYLL